MLTVFSSLNIIMLIEKCITVLTSLEIHVTLCLKRLHHGYFITLSQYYNYMNGVCRVLD